MYTTIGRNWTISFQALWTFDNETGQVIDNATVRINVTSLNKGEVTDILQENTTTGIFSFNYSSSTADILTFNATKLVTQDGTEWNTTLLDHKSELYGLQLKTVTVWSDTFRVILVSYDTDTLGTTTVSVNVTYLLFPEASLTLPGGTYSNQTLLPKIADGVNLTINGIKTQENTEMGIYSAKISNWSPTAYILVGSHKKAGKRHLQESVLDIKQINLFGNMQSSSELEPFLSQYRLDLFC
jgi:hypothetical protein